MVTRENRVMLAGLGLGALAAVVFALAQPEASGLGVLAVFIFGFWLVALVGPHVYLYRQGGGEIPKSARARFLVTLAIVLPLWVGSAMATDVTVANVGLDVALGILCLLVFLVYFVNEARHGYADFAEEAGLRQQLTRAASDLREMIDSVLFNSLANNTPRGAAGASVHNGELLLECGYL